MSNRAELDCVLDRIRALAHKYYDGQVYDHIVAIYNQLDAREQEVLLKTIVPIVSLRFSDPPLLPSVPAPQATQDVQTEIIDIELYNTKELIDLKTWLVKVTAFGFVVTFTTFSVIAVARIMLSPGAAQMTDRIVQLVSLMLGIP